MTAAPDHRVRASLQTGPVEQACRDEAQAAALFDRLRQLAPATTIERLVSGRVVEVAGLA